MKKLLPAIVLALTPVVTLAAGAGPAGRYVVDVEGTYQAMAEVGAATEQSRKMLEAQKELMALVFEGDRFSLVSGMGGTRGTCRWSLDSDALIFRDCKSAEGGAFSINGSVKYEADTGAIVIHGNAPAPIRYITP